jgi:hypothetical protein
MPFGLKNAPGHFQAFMNSVFGDLIDRGVLVYIDDLLIYAVNREEHDRILGEVFQRIRRYQLKVNPSKCVILVSEVQFLGHLICEEGLKMCPKKLAVIEDWKEPTSVKEVQSFLGLVNYYRSFIPNFSKVAAPLIGLTAKGVPFDFKGECRSAFAALKDAFRINEILAQPNQNEQFFIQCDASDYAIGAVLQQLDPHTKAMRPIGFFSRKLTPPEINYEVHDKELLAIVESLEHWRYLCIGTAEPVVIHTDHQNLKYFMSSRRLNRRQARWSLLLADYNFQIVPRPGKLQTVADPLSRQTQLQPGPEDPENLINCQTVLRQERLSPAIQEILAIDDSSSEQTNSDYDVNEYQEFFEETLSQSSEEPDDDLMEQDWEAGEIRADSPDPLWFKLMLSKLIHGYVPLVYSPRLLDRIFHNLRFFTMNNGRLHRKVRLNAVDYTVPYVPIVHRKELMKKYHVVLGHMAANSLLPLLTARFYWPLMRSDVLVAKCVS